MTQLHFPHRLVIAWPSSALCLAALLAFVLGTDVCVSLAQQPAPQANAASLDLHTTHGQDSLTSPRATMHTFLTAIENLWEEPNAWSLAQSCLDFSRLPDIDEPGKQERVRQLYAVLNRIEYVDLQAMPDAEQMGDDTDYAFFPRDLATHRQLIQKIGLPRTPIKLSRNAQGQWQFSRSTVHGISVLFKQMQDLPAVAGKNIVSAGQWIEQYVPGWMISRQFLQMKYWQWIALFVIVFVGIVLDYTMRFILRVFCARVLKKRGSSEHRQMLALVARPWGLLIAAIFWKVTLGLLDLPLTAFHILYGAANVFAVLACTWAAWRVTDLLCEIMSEKAAHTDTKFDDVLVPLVRKTIKVFIVALGLIYVAGSLDIEVMPLLASLGIGGVAFAFAAKDTVENFFGSLAVLTDRPFEVGDWVVINDVEGTVEEVGFRSTRIRTFYNSQITMPNSNLVRAVVDNYGRRRYRRWKTYIGVQYDTPPDKLEAFVAGLRQLVLDHPHTRKDYYHIYFNQFSSSSLDILFYIFFDVPDWGEELNQREKMFLDIVKLAAQLQVSFAFPTQTIHLANTHSAPDFNIKAQINHDNPPRAFT